MPNYKSHLLISKFNKYTEYGPKRKVRSSVLFHAFEKEDGIAFSIVEWCGKYYPQITFKLSFKNNKFNFYRTSIKGNKNVKIVNPSRMVERLTHRAKKVKLTGLAKSQKQRLYGLLKKFCKDHSVSIKYLSKEPVTLIKQLCYPGLASIPEISKIETGQCGKFGKTNLVKSVLGTNGILSKKLLNEAITKSPTNYENIVLVSRIIKQLFGLDKAQEFLRDVNPTYIKSLKFGYREPLNLTQTIKRYKTFFSKFSFNKIKRMYKVNIDYSSWSDTVDFIRDNPNIIIPEDFEDIKDLHDKLALQLNRIKKAKLLIEKSANIEVPQAFKDCKDNWKSTRYELDLPQDGLDLVKYSEVMRNCVSTYEDTIRNGSYYIIGIKENGNLKWNIGFEIQKKDTYGNTQEPLISFSQWSGIGNSRILTVEQKQIEEDFREASPSLFKVLISRNSFSEPF